METLQKPKIGEPCNGCGLCCHIQLCNTGAFLLKKTQYLGEKIIKGKCPALLSNKDGSFSCGLVKSPKNFIKSNYREEVISKVVFGLIGGGVGCDELGDVDDVMEELKLDLILNEKLSNKEWVEKQKKNYELLLKIRQ